MSVVALDQAPQRGKGKKRGQRGKISGSVASRADNLLARFARRCFFRPHQFFLLFTMRSPVPGYVYRYILTSLYSDKMGGGRGRRGGVGGQFPRNEVCLIRAGEKEKGSARGSLGPRLVSRALAIIFIGTPSQRKPLRRKEL